MKVLQITAFGGWGCTGRIVEGIHNVLINSGYESVIAWGRINTTAENVPTVHIGNYLDQRLHALYTRLTDKCGFGSKKVTKDFIKKVDVIKPDVIHLHIMHGYYINLEILFDYLKERNIPVVWTFHDCWAFTGHCPYFDLVKCDKWKTCCYDCEQKKHHPTSWFLDNSKWNWKKKKELFTSIKNLTVVTPSEWLASLVRQSFFKDYRVEVINNGINLDDFKPTYGDIRNKYEIYDKKIVLGVSSSWVKSKGLDDFLRLADKLPNEYQIVLVGLTKEQKNALPKNIIGIEMTDNVHELAELYTAAKVFVNPTYEDNYPTTNLEALACGTPVITYKTGGSVETIKESECGVIVDQGNISELTKAILSINYNQQEKHCLCLCDANSNYGKYVELYKELLK